MASLSADRPSEVVLAARVAREFYLEGVSKVDIADRLGISRLRVARLLDSARESGLVRIEIGLPGGALDAGLSAELCSRQSRRKTLRWPDILSGCSPSSASICKLPIPRTGVTAKVPAT